MAKFRSDQSELLEAAGDTAGLLRLKAAAPIRPTKEQRPCDHGLFSDDSKQQEMFK